MIAGISGALLFFILFLTWYEVPGAEQLEQLGEVFGVDSAASEAVSFSGWESFDFIDLICLLAIIVSVGVAVMAMMGSSASLPVAGNAVTCGIGSFAFLLVLYRVINPPGEGLDREIGLWLGLLATAGIAVGGYLAMQEEGTTFSDQADRLRG
jgi:hypothetical protein